MESTWQILGQIGNNFSAELIPSITSSYAMVFVVMFIGYIIHVLPTKIKNWYQEAFINLPLWAKIIVSSITIFGIYQSMSSDLQSFIYFQF